MRVPFLWLCTRPLSCDRVSTAPSCDLSCAYVSCAGYDSALQACPETDQVKDPFREVTLFKRNFDHVVREVYMDNYRDVTRKNPNYFLTYGN